MPQTARREHPRTARGRRPGLVVSQMVAAQEAVVRTRTPTNWRFFTASSHHHPAALAARLVLPPYRSRSATRDTQRAMTEESTTPDVVELTRSWFEATNRRDWDAVMSFFAPTAVWDASPMGLYVFEGLASIRNLVEDWSGAYDELTFVLEEVVDLSQGVCFQVVTQRGRAATDGEIRQRTGRVSLWVDGLIQRITSFTDIEEARAVAKRLAQERG
jgi:ketosteroid isomerase-like protein